MSIYFFTSFELTFTKPHRVVSYSLPNRLWLSKGDPLNVTQMWLASSARKNRWDKWTMLFDVIKTWFSKLDSLNIFNIRMSPIIKKYNNRVVHLTNIVTKQTWYDSCISNCLCRSNMRLTQREYLKALIVRPISKKSQWVIVIRSAQMKSWSYLVGVAAKRPRKWQLVVMAGPGVLSLKCNDSHLK